MEWNDSSQIVFMLFGFGACLLIALTSCYLFGPWRFEKKEKH